MKKQIYITIIAGLYALGGYSQTIHLDFKQFAGKPYTYLIVHGEKQDTVSIGKLDAKGKATVSILPKYKGYVGMSHFALNDGGGLDLVVNKENFTVRSLEAQPNESNIQFIGFS